MWNPGTSYFDKNAILHRLIPIVVPDVVVYSEEERISIAFYIDESNLFLNELAGLMEVLGLEEYYKAKEMFQILFAILKPLTWGGTSVKFLEAYRICRGICRGICRVICRGISYIR